MTCFIASLLYGIKKGLELLYSVIVAILFISTIFIYYNSSAWMYTLIYACIALIGTTIILSLISFRYEIGGFNENAVNLKHTSDYAEEHGVKTFGVLIYANAEDIIELVENEPTKLVEINQVLASKGYIQ